MKTMTMMRLRALGLGCLAVALPACGLAEYTIGGAASGGGCPEGQVVCGDGCAVAGACDDCPAGQERCDDVCVVAGSCDPDGQCPTGQVGCDDGCAPADTCPCDQRCDTELEACEDSVCVCRAGLTRCDGACVDTRAEPAHCDGCGESCANGELCQDGVCIASCAGPKQRCDGACVDVTSDSLHCGGCGELCRVDEVCLSGECEPFIAIDDCASCPCADACESEESEGDQANCCDSPFLGGPVCVQAECS